MNNGGNVDANSHTANRTSTSTSTSRINTKKKKHRQDDYPYHQYDQFENVTFHLLPHSHCDAGYKKTWTEYYVTEVRAILTSVVSYLEANREARFVWSELIFLNEWMNDESVPETLKHSFRKLVLDDRRLEIVNGGYVMHDEAVTHYASWIGQTILGHDLLRELLLLSSTSEVSKVTTGYQIDPFGSSSFTPTFLQYAGYEFLLHNRIPQSIKDVMKNNRGLQFWWQNHPDKNHDILNLNYNKYEKHNNYNSHNNQTTKKDITKIFMHVYDDHYATPGNATNGFDWEDHHSNLDSTPPITHLNVQSRSDQFLALLMDKISFYRTPHILIPFGQDFRFQNASMQFHNMNQILYFINQNSQRYKQLYPNFNTISLRYSTVSQYAQSMLSYANTNTSTNTNTSNHSQPSYFPHRHGSPFLPHESSQHAPIGAWTGYYFQYTNLKQAVKVSEILLRMSDIIRPDWLSPFRNDLHPPSSFTTPPSSPTSNSCPCLLTFRTIILQMHERARKNIMLMQHHDAMPSTGYRHVIHDYMAKILASIHDLTTVIGIYLKITSNEHTVDVDTLSPYPHEIVNDDNLCQYAMNLMTSLTLRPASLVGGGTYIAHTSLLAGKHAHTDPPNILRVEMGKSTIVQILNPRPVKVTNEAFHLYTSRRDLMVKDMHGTHVTSQITQLPKRGMVELFKLSFFVKHIPPLGMTTITIHTCYITSTTDDFPPFTDQCAELTRVISATDTNEIDNVYNPNGFGSSTVRIFLNKESGDIHKILTTDRNNDDDAQKVTHRLLKHELLQYNGPDDSVYIFNGDHEPKILNPLPTKTRIHIGPIYTEAQVFYINGHSILYRIYNIHSNDTSSSMRTQYGFEVQIQTSTLQQNTNLLSRFVLDDDFSKLDELWNFDNGYQVNMHSIPEAGIGHILQPLTSQGWIQNDKIKFLIYSVDPRGFTSSKNENDVYVTWHRRNGDPILDLKAGDDGSCVQSSVWLGFIPFQNDDFMSDGEPLDLVGFQSDISQSFEHMWIFNNKYLPALANTYIQIPYLSREGEYLRLVIRGFGTFDLNSLFQIKISNVNLRSLTFRDKNVNDNCVIFFDNKLRHNFLNIKLPTLCALELTSPKGRIMNKLIDEIKEEVGEQPQCEFPFIVGLSITALLVLCIIMIFLFIRRSTYSKLNTSQNDANMEDSSNGMQFRVVQSGARIT